MNKYFILILIVNLIIGVALVYPLLFLRPRNVVIAPIKQKVIYKLELSLLLKSIILFIGIFVFALLIGSGLVSFNEESTKIYLTLIVALLIFS